MPKSHAAYAPEFRRQMVELVRSGRTPEELSHEFEPTAQSIWGSVSFRACAEQHYRAAEPPVQAASRIPSAMAVRRM